MTEPTENEETETSTDEPTLSRRRLIAATATAAVGAAGFATGRASADPSGVYPIASEDPLLKVRADRIVLVERQSDPSSPADGELWYNGGA
jgi:hypothetical protein